MILDPSNKFLQKLYPNELLTGADIGTLKLDLSGQYGISFHIKNEPEVEIKKWGVWGKNYNVLVVRFIIQGELEIQANCNDFSGLHVKSLMRIDDRFELICEDDIASQFIKLRFKTALFQGADSYFLE